MGKIALSLRRRGRLNIFYPNPEDIESSVERPGKELKGFQKVYLKPGEEKRINLALKPSDMKFFDACRKDWVAEAGKFKAMIGSSSRVLRLEREFELK